MPFSRISEEPLDAVCNVRVTVAEKRDLKAEASRAGLSLSQLVRRRALGRTVVARTDVATVNELRRLGGLLKLVHTESGGAYSQATADAIKALTACIEQLAEKDDR